MAIMAFRAGIQTLVKNYMPMVASTAATEILQAELPVVVAGFYPNPPQVENHEQHKATAHISEAAIPIQDQASLLVSVGLEAAMVKVAA
jgi:hypothetical protein